MSDVVDITGTITGTSLYAGSKKPRLVGRNMTITLPEVTRVTAEFKTAGGAQEFPINLLEDMEASVSTQGVDGNMFLLTAPDLDMLEGRWKQQVMTAGGNFKEVGCKVFIGVHPVTLLPGAGLEVGSPSENDITYKVHSVKLIVDGVIVLHVDKITGKIDVLGKSYGTDNDNFL